MTLNPLTNTGKTDLTGVEAELFLRPLRQLTLNATFAYTHSYILAYRCTICQTLTGSADVRGNRLPTVPDYNGSLSAEWRDNLGGPWQYYVRGDVSFAGSRYDLAADLARTQAQQIADLRIGVRTNAYELEGFATNLFNDRAQTSIFNTNDIARSTVALFAGLPVLRQVGFRARVNF